MTRRTRAHEARRYRHDRALVAPYYRRRFRWADWCIYCGDEASEMDHVLPVSIGVTLDLHRPRVRHEVRGGLWVVPCCASCNQLAGDTPFFSILEKRRHIKKLLREKYNAMVSKVEWTDDELEEIGSSLRSHILHVQHAKARMASRILWPHKID